MTTNIMAKGKITKDSQYHGQRETDKRQKKYHGQREATNDRQYHGQRETDKRQTISWPTGN